MHETTDQELTDVVAAASESANGWPLEAIAGALESRDCDLMATARSETGLGDDRLGSDPA